MAWCRRRSHLRTEMGVRRSKLMLYIPFFKDFLANMPRPLSGLIRMSVDGGSAPNSGSGGSTLLGLAPDEVEDRTRDFASLACLLARMSAKDILLSATSANTVDSTVMYYYYSSLKYTLSFPFSSVHSSVPLTIMYFFTAELRSSGYPRKSGSMIRRV